MVGEKAFYGNHFYVINPIFPEHFFGYFPAGQACRKRNFAVSSKPALHYHWNDHTDANKKKRNEKNWWCHSVWSLNSVAQIYVQIRLVIFKTTFWQTISNWFGFAVSFSAATTAKPIVLKLFVIWLSISCKSFFVNVPYIKSSKSYSQGQKIIL